ncbi:MAG: alpha/beta hydrolase [Lachnospiraceae bacterium]|nr:alpha/beta hydrolase [Lachnospiraceae bacterium]
MIKSFFGIIWSIIKFILITLLTLLVLLTLVVIAGKVFNGQKYKIETAAGIEESWYFVEGDVKQYVQMRGEDIANPIIIVIHGGPGTPMAYYSYYWQAPLESGYTIIHYDQRGAGNTYFHSEDAEAPTFDLLLNDLDALVDFVLEEYEKEQVVLVGQAWGGILGGFYADIHSEKVAALVAVGQLEALDNVPENPKEALAHLAGPDAISTAKRLAPGILSPYMTYDDIRWLATLAFDLDKALEINRELYDILAAGDIFTTYGFGWQYDMPVTIMVGENAPYSLTRAYYDTIVASEKEFVVIENAGGNPFLDQPAAVAAALALALEGVE